MFLITSFIASIYFGGPFPKSCPFFFFFSFFIKQQPLSFLLVTHLQSYLKQLQPPLPSTDSPSPLMAGDNSHNSRSFRVLFLGSKDAGLQTVVMNIIRSVSDSDDFTHPEAFTFSSCGKSVELLVGTDDVCLATSNTVVLSSCDAVVYTFSLSDKSSFDLLKSFTRDVERAREHIPIPTILLGVSGVGRGERVVSAEDANSFSQVIGTRYFEAELQSGHILMACIEDLIKSIPVTLSQKDQGKRDSKTLGLFARISKKVFDSGKVAARPRSSSGSSKS